MSDHPALENSRPRNSPWPPLVAVGLALAEVGVLFGWAPLAVGGVLLFGGSAAAAVADAGYAASPWGPLRAIGGLLAAAGALVWLAGAGQPDSVRALVRAPATDGVALRGATVVVGGALLVAVGALGRRGLLRRRPRGDAGHR